MSVNENPFVESQLDPRAQAIQDQRDEMAAGRGATTSLPPNYERLKELVWWMVSVDYSAEQIANAVENPASYWEYYERWRAA